MLSFPGDFFTQNRRDNWRRRHLRGDQQRVRKAQSLSRSSQPQSRSVFRRRYCSVFETEASWRIGRESLGSNRRGQRSLDPRNSAQSRTSLPTKKWEKKRENNVNRIIRRRIDRCAALRITCEEQKIRSDCKMKKQKIDN